MGSASSFCSNSRSGDVPSSRVANTNSSAGGLCVARTARGPRSGVSQCVLDQRAVGGAGSAPREGDQELARLLRRARPARVRVGAVSTNWVRKIGFKVAAALAAVLKIAR